MANPPDASGIESTQDFPREPSPSPTSDTTTSLDPISAQIEAMAAAWQRGESISAAEILARSPSIDSESAIRLIYEEACLRRDAGQPVDTSVILARHPRYQEQLQALLDCDRLLRPPQDSHPTPTLEPGARLGPFLLLKELGRGAVGRTFLASDPNLADRPVVLKLMPAHETEHLALARLRHTHIVPLFSEHLFRGQGLRALCMPYLGGASLDRIMDSLARTPVARRTGVLLVQTIAECGRVAEAAPAGDATLESPFRRNLEQASYVQAFTWIVACLADALHYAHARGLVHMDLKPSNVLITDDGQPMLLDFHLARAPIRPGEDVIDRLGGTVGWMAPEQERAMRAVSAGSPAPSRVDGRADIFALGLLLREGLWNFRPSSDRPNARLLTREEAKPTGGVSQALVDIIEKCLQTDPQDRYADAAALAEDLRRELLDLPLKGVRNRSWRERWVKWRRRHPAAFSWSIAVAAIGVAGLVTLSTAGILYRQHAGQIQAALEDGRRERRLGQHDAARQSLRKGLELARGVPATGALRDALQRELLLTQRAQIATELHVLAELIRSRHGLDLPTEQDAELLQRLCRVLWDRRDEVAPAYSLALEAADEQRIKQDLLEIVLVWADLNLHSSSTPPNADKDARRETLDLLDQAQAVFGSSLALDLRRGQASSGTSSGTGRDTTQPSVANPRPEPGLSQARTVWEHHDLGRFLLRAGRLEAADTEFQRVLAEKPDDFWANFYQGLCAYRLRRFSEAVAAFRVCVALQPDSAICYHNRALAFEGLGRVDQAWDDYTRALGLAPDLAPARLNRGLLASRLKRWRDAITDFDLATKSSSDRETLARVHLNWALASQAIGDRISARQHAETAAGLGSKEAKALSEILR